MSDHVAVNRAHWTRLNADYGPRAARQWAAEPSWGIWHVPDARLGLLAGARGLDVIELGCGTAYISAWLARMGARPVGLDVSEAQLATARSLQRQFGLEFPLIQAGAEAVPLAGAGFDLAVSEYGACLWCDPDAWVPEAARLLRPGGRLIFLTNALLLMLCVPDTEAEGAASDRLRRDQFGIHRVSWPDTDGVEFHLPHGEWIRVLRRNGFEVEDLIEVRPEAGATTRFEFVDPEWARRWPSEEIWVARRR